MNKNNAVISTKHSAAFKKINFRIFLILVGILSPYIYLSFFAHPFADDFDFSHAGKILNFKDGFNYFYFKIQGRYASNLLFLICPLVYNWFLGYQLVPILLFILTFLSFYWFVSAISNRRIKGIHLLSYSMLLTALYIFQMPSVSQGFYWYVGSVSYQLGAVIALIHIASIIDFANKNYFINWYSHFFLSFILLVLAMGFNEVLMALLVAFYILLYFKSGQLKSVNKNTWLFFLVVAIACFMVDILSPGTAKRAGYYTDNHHFIKSLFYTGIQSLRFLFDWMSNLPFILISVLFIPLSLFLSRRIQVFKNSFYFHPAIFSCVLFLDLFLCIFPPYWSTGILGQHRTINTAYFFFIILWFLNLNAWVNYFVEKKTMPQFHLSPKGYAITMLLVLFSFGTTKNGFYAFTDLFYGRVQAFDMEMNSRYETLKKAHLEKQENCYLKPINSRPPSLFFLDISPDPEHWSNKGYGLFFDVPHVHLVQEK